MALQLAVSAQDSGIGVAIPNAYLRIGNMGFNDQTHVRFSVVYYVNEEARHTSGAFKLVEEVMANFDHSAKKSPKEQLYTFLKTLPAYAGAEDIL